MNTNFDKDTIVALATSDGHGAIAVIRISGLEAFSTISKIFKPLKKVNIKDKITLGYIFEKEERIDQVLITYFKAPNSYTGEDIVEVSSHGSPYIYRRILHLFIKSGIRMALPGEFTMRAFLNGKIDLTQAEAVSDLIYSESQVDHQLAITQFRGETYKKIQLLRKEFIDFASIIEISIDFSEDYVEIPNYSNLSTLLVQMKENIQHLLSFFHIGNFMKEGIQVVIIGGPNVGKSTLLNTLVKYDRAIVSEIPGTTRDFIEETIYLHGVKFKLIDTAGIRNTKDKIESLGIKLTYNKISNAQVILYIFDSMSYNITKIIKELFFIYKKFKINNAIIIANKYDLSKKKLFLKEFLDKFFNISAKNKEGIDELLEIIYKLLYKKYLQSNTVLSNIRHFEALQRTLSTVEDISHGIEKGSTADLIASDIRKALYFLGKISGEITSEELLLNIFSKFCIGK